MNEQNRMRILWYNKTEIIRRKLMPTSFLFTLLHPMAKAEDGETCALAANKVLLVAVIVWSFVGGLQGKMDGVGWAQAACCCP